MRWAVLALALAACGMDVPPQAPTTEEVEDVAGAWWWLGDGAEPDRFGELGAEPECMAAELTLQPDRTGHLDDPRPVPLLRIHCNLETEFCWKRLDPSQPGGLPALVEYCAPLLSFVGGWR